MLLAQGKNHMYYRVTQLKLEQTLQIRLQTLGLTVGTIVEVLQVKRNHNSVIRIRGTRFAVGGEITQGIVVEDHNVKALMDREAII